jgi:hypothetical protein
LFLAGVSAAQAVAQDAPSTEQAPATAQRWSGVIDVGLRGAGRDVGGSLERSSLERFVSAGADFAVNEQFSIGLGVSATNSRSELDSGGVLTTKTYSPDVHIAYRGPSWHADGFAAYSLIRYRGDDEFRRRGDLLSGATDTESGDYAVGGSVGYDFVFNELVITPGADITVSYSRTDKFIRPKDSLSGDAEDSKKTTSTRLGLGADVSYVMERDWGTVALSAKGRYYTALGGEEGGTVFGFAGRSDVSLDLVGSNSGGDYGVVDFGVDVANMRGWHAGLSYSPRFDRHGILDHVGALRIGLAF